MKTIRQFVFYVCMLLTPLLFSVRLVAQPDKISKRRVIKLFKNSARERFDMINCWVLCVADSLYDQADTLELINSVNYSYSRHCCEFLSWDFFRKNLFAKRRHEICREPTLITIADGNDWFLVKFRKQSSDLYVELFNSGKLIEKFKIVAISQVEVNGENVPAIMLLRSVIEN